jgi:hypothetical protein
VELTKSNDEGEMTQQSRALKSFAGGCRSPKPVAKARFPGGNQLRVEFSPPRSTSISRNPRSRVRNRKSPANPSQFNPDFLIDTQS